MHNTSNLMLFTGNANRKLAEDVAHTLGVPYAETAVSDAPDGHDEPLPVTEDRDDLPFRTWLRVHAIPWAARRLRGISSGDGLSAKLPEAQPVHTQPLRPQPVGTPRMVGGPH